MVPVQFLSMNTFLKSQWQLIGGRPFKVLSDIVLLRKTFITIYFTTIQQRGEILHLSFISVSQPGRRRRGYIQHIQKHIKFIDTQTLTLCI